MISNTIIAVAVTLGVALPVGYMVTDREPCDGFNVQAGSHAVEAGKSFVAYFNYRACGSTVKVTDWRTFDGKGAQTTYDDQRKAVIYGESPTQPISIIAPIPLAAFPGNGRLRVVIEMTKNPIQEYFHWPVVFTPPDVSFTITAPPKGAS